MTSLRTSKTVGHEQVEEGAAAGGAVPGDRNPAVPLSKNKHLLNWVEKMADLTKPAAIHWVDGSPEEDATLKAQMVAGHAVPSIVEFIERGGHDLLVIGYMGHSALYNRLIGSTTDRLVELAPCKVLVVK